MLTAAFAATDGGSVTQRTTYAYDAIGNRVQRQGWDGSLAVTERFGYDGWDPAKPTAAGTENFDAWVDLDGGNALTMRRAFGTGHDQVVARQTSGGTVNWYQTDLTGSVRQVIDNSGVAQATAAYSAFGSVTSGSLSDRFGFTAQEHDGLTGMVSLGNGTRELFNGRFLQGDPIWPATGESNPYLYVGNAPTNWTDPSGLYGGNGRPPYSGGGGSISLTSIPDRPGGWGGGGGGGGWSPPPVSPPPVSPPPVSPVSPPVTTVPPTAPPTVPVPPPSPPPATPPAKPTRPPKEPPVVLRAYTDEKEATAQAARLRIWKKVNITIQFEALIAEMTLVGGQAPKQPAPNATNQSGMQPPYAWNSLCGYGSSGYLFGHGNGLTLPIGLEPQSLSLAANLSGVGSDCSYKWEYDGPSIAVAPPPSPREPHFASIGTPRSLFAGGGPNFQVPKGADLRHLSTDVLSPIPYGGAQNSLSLSLISDTMLAELMMPSASQLASSNMPGPAYFASSSGFDFPLYPQSRFLGSGYSIPPEENFEDKIVKLIKGADKIELWTEVAGYGSIVVIPLSIVEAVLEFAQGHKREGLVALAGVIPFWKGFGKLREALLAAEKARLDHALLKATGKIEQDLLANQVAKNPALMEQMKAELRRQMGKPATHDPKLTSMMDELYREGATVGSGSTAAAIRFERELGVRVGGRLHTQKGEGAIKFLEDWLRKNPTARPGDRAAAENVIRDLKDALGRR